MKTQLIVLPLLLAGTAAADTGTIANPWSGVSGDKANLAGFAFQANAGLYPNSISPAGSLTPTFQLDSLTLIRPNDTTTPSIGMGVRQTTSADTPVFVDVYSTYDGTTLGGYLGSSSSGVAWNSTAADQPFTFTFVGIALQADQKYWFVFSEDNVDGELSNFRLKVSTAGDDVTPGPGKGYLVNDTLQVIKAPAGASDNWGVAYTVGFTTIPEPGIAALLAAGGLLISLRKRV